jgi:hypothetical protein
MDGGPAGNGTKVGRYDWTTGAPLATTNRGLQGEEKCQAKNPVVSWMPELRTPSRQT